VAAVSVGLCEWSTRLLLPRVPTAVEVPRNPYRYRGWPEYTSEIPAGPRTNTLVLITNCQGYGGEYRGSRVYAPRLERVLSENAVNGSTNWVVLNWAIDGVTSMEYVLFAAYLHDYSPDLVLAVMSFADYRQEHFNEGLSYCRSDVPRLATRWNVYRRLPAAYRRRHIRVEGFLTSWVLDRLALKRLKEYGWSWIDRRYPGVHNVYYAPHVHYLPWALPKRFRIEPIRLPKRSVSPMEVTYGEPSRIMLEEYIRTLKPVQSRVVLVAEPTAVSEHNPHQQRFIADLTELARENGLPCWDLHNALPDDRFLTTGHLQFRNHVRLANILAERIEALPKHAASPASPAGED